MVNRMTCLLAACAALVCAASVPSMAQDKPPAASAPAAVAPVSGYHLVLLVADDKAGGQLEGVTPAVAQAIKDVQQFLPFKAYRLLDATLLRGDNGGSTRVNGLGGRVYTMELRGSQGPREVGVALSLFETFQTGTGEQKARQMLRNDFTMAPGETVVAGTSRLDSGEALVVVVTALAPSALR